MASAVNCLAFQNLVFHPTRRSGIPHFPIITQVGLLFIVFWSYALCLGASNMQPASKFFVLGSGSFTRKLILKNAGYTFSVIKADIDERAIGNRDDASQASALVLLLANAKADAVLPKIPELFRKNVLLTADQVVVHDNRILEKPQNREEARRFIEGYSRTPCSTVGSIVLTDISTGKRVSGVGTATIYFDPIPSSVIEELLDEGECADASVPVSVYYGVNVVNFLTTVNFGFLAVFSAVL